MREVLPVAYSVFIWQQPNHVIVEVPMEVIGPFMEMVSLWNNDICQPAYEYKWLSAIPMSLWHFRVIADHRFSLPIPGSTIGYATVECSYGLSRQSTDRTVFILSIPLYHFRKFISSIVDCLKYIAPQYIEWLNELVIGYQYHGDYPFIQVDITQTIDIIDDFLFNDTPYEGIRICFHTLMPLVCLPGKDINNDQ